MIEAPQGTPCVISISLKKDASQVVFANYFVGAHSGDIDSSWIISKEYDSDIEGFSIASNFIKSIKLNLPIEADYSEKFNPIYLPQSIKEDDIDFDVDGEIVGVAGFSNPYAISEIILALAEDVLAKGKVIYEDFDLPDVSVAMLVDSQDHVKKIN
jgi:hypothetical protein